MASRVRHVYELLDFVELLCILQFTELSLMRLTSIKLLRKKTFFVFY